MSNSIHLGDFFPRLFESVSDIHHAFILLSSVVLLASLVFKFMNLEAVTPSFLIRLLLWTGLTVLAIVFFPDAVDGAQLFFHGLSNELGADPSKTNEEFLSLLVASGDGSGGNGGDVGFWDILWMDEGGLGMALTYALLSLIGYIASAVLFIFRLVQQIILIFAIVVSPLMLAFFHFEITRGAASKFVLSLLGLLFWPLGWNLASIGTQELLAMAFDEQIYQQANGNIILTGSVFFFFMIVISLWVLITTIAAPILIARMVESGSQFGSAILGSFSSSFGRSFAYGSAAAVGSARFNDTSFPTSMTVGAAAGLGGAVTSAAETSNVVIPAAISLIPMMGIAKKVTEKGDES